MVNGGTAALAAGTPVASTLQLTSGTVTLTGVVTVPSLTMSGGTLTGSGTLGAASQVTWTGGTLSGPLTNAGTITVAGTGYKALTGTLTNTGTIAVTGSGRIYAAANGVTITNQAGAVFDFQADAGLSNYDPNFGNSSNGLLQQRRHAREVGGHRHLERLLRPQRHRGGRERRDGTLACKRRDIHGHRHARGGRHAQPATAAGRSAARRHSSARSASPPARTRWPTGRSPPARSW